MLAMGKGKTQATFLTPLVRATFHASAVAICFVPPFIFQPSSLTV